MTETDETLLSRSLKGDKQAFTLLYQRYGERLFRFFKRTLKTDSATAADFTQELFLKVITKGNQFQTGAVFSTWTYTIAWNMCKNYWRQQRKWDHSLDTFENTIVDFSEENHLLSYEKNQRADDCLKTLESLPESHKICIHMRFYDELSIPEIALILDIPEGTVKSRIHYALKKMASPLKLWKPE